MQSGTSAISAFTSFVAATPTGARPQSSTASRPTFSGSNANNPTSESSGWSRIAASAWRPTFPVDHCTTRSAAMDRSSVSDRTAQPLFCPSPIFRRIHRMESGTRAVVAGIGESTYYERGRSPHSELQPALTAIRAACADAGLAPAEIDGFVSYLDQRNDPLRLSAALGVRSLSWTSQPWGGGGNNMAAALQLAAAAVAAGYARHVIAFRALAQGQFGRFGQARASGRTAGDFAYQHLYGLLSPAQECALHTKRFLHDHGISQEALAEIALAAYANAQRNPRAIRHGQPLTREAYHASRWIVEPFHLYDCCPENDGAAAVLVTTAERARDLRGAPVAVLAAAQGLGPAFGISAYQGEWFPGVFYRDVAAKLWQRSGCKPADVDVLQLYENFTG